MINWEKSQIKAEKHTSKSPFLFFRSKSINSFTFQQVPLIVLSSMGCVIVIVCHCGNPYLICLVYIRHRTSQFIIHGEVFVQAPTHTSRPLIVKFWTKWTTWTSRQWMWTNEVNHSIELQITSLWWCVIHSWSTLVNYFTLVNEWSTSRFENELLHSGTTRAFYVIYFISSSSSFCSFIQLNYKLHR